MAKPGHNCWKMDRIATPHDVIIDNLKIGEYRQMEFDSAELESVRNYEMKQGVYGKLQSASDNPYDYYDSSDLEADSDIEELTDEKATNTLPLPVTTSTSNDKPKLTKTSKFLLVLTCLMLFSLSHHSSCLDTTDHLEPPQPEYQHTQQLQELYDNFNANL